MMKVQNLLEKLVSINSVFPNELELSKFLQNYLYKIGFKITSVITDNNRPNIIATYGKSKKYLGFYGHMDTVPAASDYKENPFKVKYEKNGQIAKGLGACDMKGGITAILNLARFAYEKKLPVKIIFGADEENISQGAHDLVDSKLLKDINFMIVAEGGQIKDLRQDISVVYGRKGRIVFDIRVFGRAAHAAEYEKGINAIENAAKLVLRLQKQSFKKHPKLGRTALVVQYIHSESSAFSVPDLCTVRLSLLTSPYDNSNKFIKETVSLAKKMKIKISINTHKRNTPYGESYEISLNNAFLKKINKNVLTKYRFKPIYTGSVADENVFANRLNIPVLTIGSLGGGDHTSNEWLDLISLSKVIQVYKEILKEYNS